MQCKSLLARSTLLVVFSKQCVWFIGSTNLILLLLPNASALGSFFATGRCLQTMEVVCNLLGNFFIIRWHPKFSLLAHHFWKLSLLTY